LVQSIYELKVDWGKDGHFRAIYFPYNLEGTHHYCFTYAFIKTRKPPFDKTDEYRDKTKKNYERIRKNPDEIRTL